MAFVSPTFLLDCGADVNAQAKEQWTPLHLASFYGKPDIAGLLLDHGANANAKDDLLQTPLHLVAAGIYESQEDGIRVAQLLLEHSVDVNAFDVNRETALHAASSNGRVEIARVLLEHTATRNGRGQKSSHLSLESEYSPKY